MHGQFSGIRQIKIRGVTWSQFSILYCCCFILEPPGTKQKGGGKKKKT